MKKSNYSDAQIMSILKQAEGGVPVADLCREHGLRRPGFLSYRYSQESRSKTPISKVITEQFSPNG